MSTLLIVFILVPGLIVGAWFSFKKNMVPNWLNGALLVSGFVAQGFAFGWNGILMGFLGLVLGLALLIVFWLKQVIGAGSVKFLAVIGVWVGPYMVALIFLVTVVISALLALVGAIFGRKTEVNRIPDGAAISLSTAILLLIKY